MKFSKDGEGQRALLCYHLLPHSRSPVSLKREIMRISGTLIFVDAALGMLLDHLVLVVSGLALNWLPVHSLAHGTGQRQQT